MTLTELIEKAIAVLAFMAFVVVLAFTFNLVLAVIQGIYEGVVEGVAEALRPS